MNTIIDTHAHLEEIEDLGSALASAKTAGVEAVIAAGSSYESNKQLLEICKQYKNFKIYTAFGIHPGEVETCRVPEAVEFLEKHIKDAIAIGEIGLDYWYKQARKDGPGRNLQNEFFKKQLELSIKHNKPVVIHSRGAWRACLDMTLETGVKKGIFHWYSGPEDVLKDLLDAGFFISATPSCEYSKEHIRAIEIAPLEKILLETDSPVTYKPESGSYKSEPGDVYRTLKAVARIKNMDEETLAQKTTETAIKFFGLK